MDALLCAMGYEHVYGDRKRLGDHVDVTINPKDFTHVQHFETIQNKAMAIAVVHKNSSSAISARSASQ